MGVIPRIPTEGGRLVGHENHKGLATYQKSVSIRKRKEFNLGEGTEVIRGTLIMS